MYQKIYTFHTPDPETIAWRYIDFTKYIDLLTTQQLFFCRSDKFDDPFEGLFQLKDYEQNKHMFTSFPETKKFYFINSWHMNTHQSDAMWKIFTNTNNGIAIKSSVGKLITALNVAAEDVNIGQIYYRDYDNITFRELSEESQNQLSARGASTNQFNYKRISFEHEKELRLYYIDLPIPHTTIDGIPRQPLEFKKIKVDLSSLIEEIVIAPFADQWFKDLVISVTEKLNFHFNISTSTLYKLKD